MGEAETFTVSVAPEIVAAAGRGKGSVKATLHFASLHVPPLPLREVSENASEAAVISPEVCMSP